ncbi:MAG TPA: OsmC family peroxiredoxin [Longimicrobiaceae bacterium]
MPTRNAEATWEGTLTKGKGTYKAESGSVGGSYNFGTRFEDTPGSNPEELLAAAHAACFSMALSGQIEKLGGTPQSITTEAACTVERVGQGFKITTMELRTRARVSGMDEAKFQEAAQNAKTGCPVSQALAGVDIKLDAALE